MNREFPAKAQRKTLLGAFAPLREKCLTGAVQDEVCYAT
jgi:hypothetical protein